MKLVIFDLDGTLLNTVADLGNAVNHTLESCNLPIHDVVEYKKMIGHGMRNLVKNALPDTHQDDSFIDSFLKEFLDWYSEHIDVCTVPYPGIIELVNNLHRLGFKLAIASNKFQKGTETLIRKFFPDIPFVAVCGNGSDFPLKPDAALVQSIMEKAGADTDDSYMVGDSSTDIKTGHNASVRAIAVTWGFRPVEDLQDAEYIVDSPEQILHILTMDPD